MQRRVWRARVFPGKLDEYVKRHDEIWPDMKEALKRAGVRNYTIWHNGDELVGYYECEDLVACEKYKSQSCVMKRWSESMKDVMEMERDAKTGETTVYSQVFELM